MVVYTIIIIIVGNFRGTQFREILERAQNLIFMVFNFEIQNSHLDVVHNFVGF